MSIMTNICDIINDIEKRAKAVGVTMAKLCQKAGVNNSTFTRWKSRKGNPKVSTYMKFTQALDLIESRNRKPRKENAQ